MCLKGDRIDLLFVWLVLLPVVWSRCETFSFCFDILCAINHGMTMELSPCKGYTVYSLVW